MSLYETLLFLHVIAAFALVAALVLFTVAIVVGWRIDVPSKAVGVFRLSIVGNVLVGVGTLGTLIFGIALALERDQYQIWDGWIIAAIVLWAITGEVGRRTGKVYNAARDRAKALAAEGDASSGELRAMLQSRKGLWLHLATIALVVLILADMIWKPGA